jgi:transcriptional regulator with XRE-family HTH domain
MIVSTPRDVAALIRQARRTRHLSQAELGKATGVTRQSIANLEAGRSNPGLSTVLAALAVLDLRLDVVGPPEESAGRAPAEPAEVPADTDLDAVLNAVRTDSD